MSSDRPPSTAGRDGPSAPLSMPQPPGLPPSRPQRVARALRTLADDFSDPAMGPAAIEYASWLRLLRRTTP